MKKNEHSKFMELLDDYLLGKLPQNRREELECHYFECDTCFRELLFREKVHRAAREKGEALLVEGVRSRKGLSSALELLFGTRRPLVYAAVTAAAALCLLLGYQQLLEPNPYLELVRLKPYPYFSPGLRGGAGSEESFRRGMDFYLAQEYGRAIVWLERVVEASPQHPEARLYLGVSYLLEDQPDRAIHQLKAFVQMKSGSEAAHWYLGQAYLMKGDGEKARLEFEEVVGLNGSYADAASEMIEAIENLEEGGSSEDHFQRGKERLQSGEYERAIEEFALSIEKDPSKARAYGSLVEVYLSKGDPEGAESHLKRFIREDRTNACAHYGLGHLMCEKERWEESLNSLARAVQLDPDLALAYYTMGTVYFNTSKYERALAVWDTAFSIFQKAHETKGMMGSQINLGLVHHVSGDFAEAIACYQRALKLQEDDKPLELFIVGNMGLAYHELGDLSQALEYAEESLKLSRELGDEEQEARALNNIGRVYYALGDLKQALSYLNQTLEINRNLGRRSGEALNLNNCGLIYLDMENLDEAKQCMTRALKINRKLKNQEREADNLRNLGRIHQHMGDIEKAQTYYNEALDLSRRVGLRLRESSNLKCLGEIHRTQGDYPRALTYYRKGLDLATEIGLPEEIRDCQRGMGEICRSRGDNEMAFRHYQSAIETIESMWRKLRVEEFQTSFMEGNRAAYEGIINLLLEMGKWEEAFDYGERARARSFLNILANRQFEITEGIASELYERFKDAEKRLRTIQTSLTEKISRVEVDSHQVDSLRNALEEVKREHLKIREEIQLKHPRYADLTGASSSLTMGEVQRKVLKDGTVLLEYFVGEEKSFLWIVREDSVLLKQIDIGREELRELVVRIREPLVSVSTLADIGFHLDAAHEVYRRVFQPAEDYLTRGEVVLIIPDGVLHYLPFDLLVVDPRTSTDAGGIIHSQHEGIEYLVKRYPMVYASSASVMDPDLWEGRTIGQERLLALGNPNCYDDEQGDSRETLDGWNFPKLPFSEQEVRAIQGIYPSVTCLIGQDATEERVKEEACQFSHIHFSTHGLLDEVMPLYSGLVMTLDDDPAEDGLLQTYEIFNLNLNADLVALSACETGLGKLHDGEGIIGLTRAFLYAGTRSVVVSLWKVNDESTSLFMEEFYRGMKKEGLSKVKALWKAKLKLMSESKILNEDAQLSYSHPFFWAPFVLVGERE